MGSGMRSGRIQPFERGQAQRWHDTFNRGRSPVPDVLDRRLLDGSLKGSSLFGKPTPFETPTDFGTASVQTPLGRVAAPEFDPAALDNSSKPIPASEDVEEEAIPMRRYATRRR